MQVAAFIGPYGLSFITVALTCLPLLLLGKGKRIAALFAASIFVLGSGVLWTLGAIRLNVPTIMESSVTLRLVQGNIPRDVKWDPGAARSIMDRYLRLSSAQGAQAPTHIIWPETSLPYLFEDRSDFLQSLTQSLPDNASLIFGATRTAVTTFGTPGMLNSIIALDRKGVVIGIYDKKRLVPFGEYMPLKNILPVKKMTEGVIDYVPGEQPQVLKLSGLAHDLLRGDISG